MDQPRTLADSWKGLDVNSKVMSVLAVLAAIAITVAAVAMLTKPDLVPLNRTVTQEQLPDVISSLEANSIPYSVTNTGEISVDSASLDATYAILAKGGFNQVESSGYDHLLNGQNVYTSQIKEDLFKNQVNEEELSKLIKRIDGVIDAKVKLALSKESQFLRDASPAKASVVITTKNGKRLSKKQIEGIVQIVAGGIPNLPAANVTVLDQSGKILSTKDNESNLSGTHLEFKKNIEDEVELKITSLLTPLVGFDSFSISVEAEINFDRVENTTDAPIEPSLVVSNFAEIYTDSESFGAQGVAGSLSNQPPAQAQFEQTPETASPTQESNFVGTKKTTTNYEIGRSITHTVFAGREIQKLNVSILLNESFYETPEAATAAIEAITPMIIAGVGINDERGDNLAITSAPFFIPEIAPEPEPEFHETAWFKMLIDYLKWIFALLLLYLLIWRPLLKKGESSKPSEESVEEAPPTKSIDELMAEGLFDMAADGANAATFKDALQEEKNAAYSAFENADLVATIFNGWLENIDLLDEKDKKDPASPNHSDSSQSEEEMMAAMMDENSMSEEAMVAAMMDETGVKK